MLYTVLFPLTYAFVRRGTLFSFPDQKGVYKCKSLVWIDGLLRKHHFSLLQNIIEVLIMNDNVESKQNPRTYEIYISVVLDRYSLIHSTYFL